MTDSIWEKNIFGIQSCRSYLKDLLLIVILHDQGHLPDKEWEDINSSFILKLVNDNQELSIKSILPSDFTFRAPRH